MSVVVLNHSVVKDFIASIHKDGCGAIEKEKISHGSSVYGPYSSVESAMSDYLDEEMIEMGYHEGDVKIHGCTKGHS